MHIFSFRGKEASHDVDLLISHPDNNMVTGLLDDFIRKLQSKVMIAAKLLHEVHL